MRWPAPHPSEHQEQVAVMQWAKAMTATIPELNLLFAIPNGGQRPRVRLFKHGGAVTFSSEGLRLCQEGVKPGVPDLFLPVSRHDYHGLFVEMKRVDGKLSAAQQAWRAILLDQGYAVIICHGADIAIKEIVGYLSKKPWNPIGEKEQ